MIINTDVTLPSTPEISRPTRRPFRRRNPALYGSLDLDCLTLMRQGRSLRDPQAVEFLPSQGIGGASEVAVR